MNSSSVCARRSDKFNFRAAIAKCFGRVDAKPGSAHTLFGLLSFLGLDDRQGASANGPVWAAPEKHRGRQHPASPDARLQRLAGRAAGKGGNYRCSDQLSGDRGCGLHEYLYVPQGRRLSFSTLVSSFVRRNLE